MSEEQELVAQHQSSSNRCRFENATLFSRGGGINLSVALHVRNLHFRQGGVNPLFPA